MSAEGRHTCRGLTGALCGHEGGWGGGEEDGRDRVRERNLGCCRELTHLSFVEIFKPAVFPLTHKYHTENLVMETPTFGKTSHDSLMSWFFLDISILRYIIKA